MAKKIQTYIKAQIPSGQAAPASLGSTLGPAGVNIMEFCKAFNARTQAGKPGVPTPVVITVYSDRSFEFITKKPPVSYYLKEESQISKGAKTTGRETVGEITLDQIKKIAEEKMVDLNARSIDAASKMIIGSARSMGLKVQE